MIRPEIGEEVLEVRQAMYWLIDQLDGCPLADAAPHTNTDPKDPNSFFAPSWTPFTAGMPRWGTGLMVARDGVLARSLSHWDSSD